MSFDPSYQPPYSCCKHRLPKALFLPYQIDLLYLSISGETQRLYKTHPVCLSILVYIHMAITSFGLPLLLLRVGVVFQSNAF